MKPRRDAALDRRTFLGQGSGLALGLLGVAGLNAEELIAPGPSIQDEAVEPIGCAVVGLGPQGRAILTALKRTSGAEVRYVCDSYARIHKRALEIAPAATALEDYRAVLDDPGVRAVWVATPSHRHEQIAVAALDAGKHVYCEAPLASRVEPARAIAAAAQRAQPRVFQAGLQRRCHPMSRHVLGFVRTGVLGRRVQTRAQWHEKISWRRAAATPERESALNWRLSHETSGGLMAEQAIHQLDVQAWFLGARPRSVSAFGGVRAWRDGREVADTVQCIFEYADDFNSVYEATLASSYDGAYDVFSGRDATILLRESRAWMFKEADAPSLGWEVYATREKIGDETGIALVADATKLLAKGQRPASGDRGEDKSALEHACASFLTAIRNGSASECGPVEGYEATLIALKANEALVTGSQVDFEDEWFNVA